MLLWLLVVLATAQAYTGKFDNINIDELLKNDRLLTRYLECFKGVGVCTPDGLEIKELIPDALGSGCEKCSDDQKENIKHVMRYMMKERQSDFEELEKLYDPKCAYRKKYKVQIAELGVVLADC